jgi:hypothetical protein
MTTPSTRVMDPFTLTNANANELLARFRQAARSAGGACRDVGMQVAVDEMSGGNDHDHEHLYAHFPNGTHLLLQRHVNKLIRTNARFCADAIGQRELHADDGAPNQLARSPGMRAQPCLVTSGVPLADATTQSSFAFAPPATSMPDTRARVRRASSDNRRLARAICLSLRPVA